MASSAVPFDFPSSGESKHWNNVGSSADRRILAAFFQTIVYNFECGWGGGAHISQNYRNTAKVGPEAARSRSAARQGLATSDCGGEVTVRPMLSSRSEPLARVTNNQWPSMLFIVSFTPLHVSPKAEWVGYGASLICSQIRLCSRNRVARLSDRTSVVEMAVAPLAKHQPCAVSSKPNILL